MTSETDGRGVHVDPAPSGNEQQIIDVYPGDGIAIGQPGQDAGSVSQDGNTIHIDFGDGGGDDDDTTVVTHTDDDGGDTRGGDDGGGDDGGGDDGGGDDSGGGDE